MPKDLAGEELGNVDIETAFSEWSSATKPPRGTLLRYRTSARALARSGIVRMEQLSRPVIAEHQDRGMREGRSPSALNVDMSMLKNVVAWLYERGRFPWAKVEDLWPSWVPVPGGVPGFYTRARFEELRGVAATIAPWLSLGFAVACYTGARRGELRRLDREDFDTRRKVVVIHRRLDLGQDTKNHRGRVVSLCSDILEIVDREAPKSGPLIPAIRKSKSAYVSARSFDRATQALCRSSGEAAVWRMARSTFTTWSLQRDIQPPDVSRALGHSSLELLYRNYYAWIQGYNPAFERLSGPDEAA